MGGLIMRLLVALGGFFNRVRGGLDVWFGDNAPLNKIWFPLFLAAITKNGWMAPACYIGQQICGWGAYIGSLTTGVKPAPECKIIDWLCKPFEFNARWWGFVALAIRGLVWMAPIAIAMKNWQLLLMGFYFPVCYAIPTLLLLKTKYNNTKAAWNIGEILWGMLLSYAVLSI